MGGYGSGQYQSRYAKSVVEDCLTLDIFRLHRQKAILFGARYSGIFTAGKNSSMRFVFEYETLTLFYTIGTQAMSYDIRISETTPHFGGQRLWFHCPQCDRRVGKLHLAPGELYYLCRSCANLTYQSTREPSLARLMALIARECG